MAMMLVHVALECVCVLHLSAGVDVLQYWS